MSKNEIAVRSNKAVAKAADEETLAVLSESFPVEQGGSRFFIPRRISMVSQDVVEGKGKSMKVVTEAGTFFLEKQLDDIDEETGKKAWEKLELGTSFKGIILFQRKQLKMYDEKTEQFTSSPVYDSEDEVIPLFCDKAEVAKGTPKELKAKYQYTDKDNKVKSKLEDNRILYVMVGDELYQMNLRGSSMYSFLTYARKISPPTVVTEFCSEAKEKGTIAWNQMTFTPVRKLTQKEAEAMIEQVSEIKQTLASEKLQFASNVIDAEAAKKVEDEFNAM